MECDDHDNSEIPLADPTSLVQVKLELPPPHVQENIDNEAVPPSSQQPPPVETSVISMETQVQEPGPSTSSSLPQTHPAAGSGHGEQNKDNREIVEDEQGNL